MAQERVAGTRQSIVAPFLGRQEDLDLLVALLDTVEGGTPGWVVVEGEAGVGKSRLVAQFNDIAEARSICVLRGRADALAAARPFGPLVEALSPLRRRHETSAHLLKRLRFSNGGSGETDGLSAAGFSAVDAFLECIEDRAMHSAVVLVVEDLHLADASTLAALSALSRRVEGGAIGLLGTVRPLPRTSGVDRLLATIEAHGGRVHRLAPLGPADSGELLRILIGAKPGPTLRRWAAKAGGNPLLITELVASLFAEGAIAKAGRLADTSREELLPSLRQTVLRRLAYLSDSTASILATAATLGANFEVEDLAAVGGCSPADLVGSIGEAVRAGVISERDEQLTFSHELVRDCFYGELTVPVARSLHHRYARRLAEVGAPAPVVGSQFLLASPRPGDLEAASWLARAGRESAPTDPAAAAGFLSLAARLMTPSQSGCDEVLAAAAMALGRSGRCGEAEALAREMLGRDHGRPTDAVLHLVLGRARMGRGLVVDAIAEFESATFDRTVQRSARRGGLSEVLLGRTFGGDLAEVEATARHLLDLGESVGDELASCVALCTKALLADHRGNLRESVDLANRAVVVADATPGRRAHHFAVHLYRARLLMGQDRMAEAAKAHQEGRAIAKTLRLTADIAVYSLSAGVRAYYCGDFDDATAQIHAGLTRADQLNLPLGPAWGHALSAIIAVHRDDMLGAEVSLAAAEASSDDGSQPFDYWSRWAAALLAEARGDVDGAAGVQADLVEGRAAVCSRDEMVNLAPDAVRLCIASGQASRAESIVVALEDAARNAGTKSASGAALWCRGLLDDDPDTLVRAAAAYEVAQRRMCAAQARAAAAEALGRAGRQDEACQLFAQSLADFERAGAYRDMARARAAQRILGLRSGARGKRLRPASGWASLTATETRVATLAAEGLTNAEIAHRSFVSTRTVEGHLGRIFSKLGIHSRVQLAAVDRDNGTGLR